MSKIEAQTLKGFNDYLPEEERLRQKIIDTAREVFELYGFLPISTPALEYLEVLTEKYGEDEKLIYNFKDRGGRAVGLRYDLTVPLARVISQYQNEIKLPFRRYQIGSSWRADNPQKGRYREFIQADADIVGVESLSADAECIAVYNEIFQRLNIKNYKIRINNRKIFERLGDEISLSEEQLVVLTRFIDKLDKKEFDEIKIHLLESGFTDDQIFKVKDFVEKKSTDYEEFEKLKKYLNALSVPENAYEFDVNIARGLDYYTGTVFEVVVTNSDFGSFGGGGRYDDLVEKFSGKKISAVGMSVGVDRLLAYILEEGIQLAGIKATQVLVFNMGEKYKEAALKVLVELRNNNISAEYYYDSKDMGKQFDYAEKLKIPYGILIGEEEIKTKQVTLRDLSSRKQETDDIKLLLTKILK